MMKFTKRLLTVLILVSTILIPVKAAESDVTDIGIAKYYTESVVSETELRNGVKHVTHKGFTSAIEGQVTDMGMGVTEDFVPSQYYGQQVSILDIPSSSGASLIPWAYITDSAWNLETVGNIAKDYESKHPGEKVIAAVNGDFYDISGSKMYPFTPNNIQVSNGDVFKSVKVNSAVGFLNDGSSKPLVGNKPIVRDENPTLAIYDNNNNIIKEFVIDKVNAVAEGDEIAVIYPKFGVSAHQEAPKSLPIDVIDAYIVHDGEYSIPYSGVPGIFGYESDNADFFGKGIITKYGSGTLKENDFAIKTNNAEVIEYLSNGTKIRVQYQLSGDFTGVENVIGYNQAVLYDGEKVGNITQRAPRTMVGVKADGSYVLSVVDGRQPDKLMYGATSAEMAAILTHYGVVEAYNLDGGGSSAMVVLDDETNQFRIVNTYSDSRERPVSNALLVVVKNPVIKIEPIEVSASNIKLNIEIINENGFSGNNYYVELNGEMKQVVSGEVEFDNLTKQVLYTYQVFYKENEAYIYLYHYGDIKTSKEMLKLNHLKLYFEGNDLIINLDLTDNDKVLVSGKILLDDKEATIINGIAIFRGFKGSYFGSITPKLVYNLESIDGEKTVELVDYIMYCESDIVLDYSLNLFNQFHKNND